MSSELAVGVVIGASLRAGFTSVFGRAKKTVGELGSEIRKVTKEQDILGRKLSAGIGKNTRGLSEMRRRYDILGAAINKAAAAQKGLNKAIQSQERAKQFRNNLRAEMIDTVGHGAVVVAPVISAVKVFLKEENAETNLKMAMQRADGSFGAFEIVRKEVVKLGRDLPGTTAEFYELGKVLKSQGLSDKLLINGGLGTSAKLNTVMGMDQAQGGEFFAKLVEARGLTENEFAKAADLTQRAYFGFGLKKDDMFESMKYNATASNLLGLKGLGNYEKLLALEGMGAQVGLEGSQFGTNFAQMLSQMAQGPKAMAMAKSGMKKEAKGILAASGIDFEFFDKKGKFKGLDSMVSELEKLKKIKAEQGEQAALIVAEEMFGTQAARPALVIAEKGRAGLEANLKLMREQADLEARIATKTATLGAALESLGGVAEHTAAIFGSVFAADIQNFAKTAQGFLENTLQPWLKENKQIIKLTLAFIAGLFGAKLAVLGLGYAFSVLAMPIRALVTAGSKANAVFRLFKLMRLGQVSKGVMLLRMFGMSAKAATSVSKILGTAWRSLVSVGSVLGRKIINLAKWLPMAAKGFMMLGRFLLATPIGFALGLLATAAYLLYRNWDGVVGGAKALWQSLSETVSAVCEAVSGFFGGAWERIKSFFSSGIDNISATILKWSPLGLFMQVMDAVLNWFGSTLPAQFTGYGSMLVSGLINGIKSKIGAAIETVRSLANQVKSVFTSARGMDIHSPSRVFMRYGGWITEGLTRGIAGTADRPVYTVGRLAGRLREGFASRIGGFRDGLAARIESARAAFSAARAQAVGGGMVIHYNPTINAPGGNPEQIRPALQMSQREFEQMFRRMMADKARRAY